MSKDSLRLAQMALDSAKAKWGKGWAHLSPELREGAVAREVVMLILGWENHQDHPSAEVSRAALKLLD